MTSRHYLALAASVLAAPALAYASPEGLCGHIEMVIADAAGPAPFSRIERENDMHRVSGALGAIYCSTGAEGDGGALICDFRASDTSRYSRAELTGLQADYGAKRDTLFDAIKACPQVAGWEESANPDVLLDFSATGSDRRLTNPANGQAIIGRTRTHQQGSKGRYSWSVGNVVIFTEETS